MSEQSTTPTGEYPALDDSAKDSFANHVLSDWGAAMERFFNDVDRKRRTQGLTGAQVREALNRGYGHEVGDEWDEWYGDGDSDDD